MPGLSSTLPEAVDIELGDSHNRHEVNEVDRQQNQLVDLIG